MSKFFDYIKSNVTGSVIISAGLALVMGIALLQGCQLADIIEVELSQNVASETHTKTSTSGKVSLKKAIQVRQKYVAAVKFNLAELDEGIEDGLVFHDLLTALLDTGLQLGQSSAASIPGGAILFGALFGTGGLFLRKPGTTALINKEKQASFNKGQQTMANNQAFSNFMADPQNDDS